MSIYTKNYIRDNVKLFIVVAAYNEEEPIYKVIKDLQELTNHIIIVDDGSIDRTAQIAESAGCIVVSHPTNQGQGAAIRTGVTLAVKENATYIATFDADGQHDVNDLYQMVVLMMDSKKDVIIGSRFLGSAPGIPLKRVILLKIGIIFTYFFSGVILTDVHNGLRLFTKEAATKIDFSNNGMAHASVIIDSLIREKLNFVEFPVTITYTKYSKMKGQKLMDIIRIGVHIIIVKSTTRLKKMIGIKGRV